MAGRDLPDSEIPVAFPPHVQGNHDYDGSNPSISKGDHGGYVTHSVVASDRSYNTRVILSVGNAVLFGEEMGHQPLGFSCSACVADSMNYHNDDVKDKSIIR
ncbi:hypothetical protein ACLOJK_016234 [Asimina triloba]